MEKGNLCVFFSLLLLLLLLLLACARGESVVNTLRDNNGDSVVSKGGTFELGFFSPYGIRARRYVGIWFSGSEPKVVVWVANRDKPLHSNNGVFTIMNGNLNVLDSKNTSLWSTEIQPSSNTSLVLMDSGNLILKGLGFNRTMKTLWQSFQNPTDTLLPGMSMTSEFTSWKSADDPSKGDFTFLKVTEGHFMTQKLGERYWFSKQHRYNFSSQTEAYSWMEYDLSSIPTFSDSALNRVMDMDYDYAIAVMDYSGKLQYKTRNKESRKWDVIWSKPDSKCDVVKACGSFASCRSDSRHTCRCLPGFEPKSMDEWNSAHYSSGCQRKSEICTQEVKSEEFLTVYMKPEMASYIIPIPSNNTEDECKTRCQQNCKCQAYSRISVIRSQFVCAIWDDELEDIWENADGAGPINIRMKHSDFALTKMDCNSCGSNIVPYPLSTDSICGDPMYRNFTCNASGLLLFKPGDFGYNVTNINFHLKTFTIKTNGSICRGNDIDAIQKLLKLEHSSTFNVSSGCDSEFNEIDIRWETPLEPICNSLEDCINWPNSSCNSSTDGKNRCLCNPSYEWTSIGCYASVDGGNPFHLEQRNTRVGIIVSVSIAGFIVISCLVLYIYYTRRKLQSKKDQIATFWENQETTRLYESEKRIKDFMGSGTFGEDDRKAIEVPVFDLDTILIATDNFSEANKIGRGGFGTVYKGLFPGGLRIAIKRLSQGSAQGVDEFKNEAILIAKLQHRNLVRLLGYCVAGEEKMLVYEYMPNKSLDFFIFDRTQCFLVNWEMRFNIIVGIARGLVYLHEDSRLRIIHRDMKTSNVLLDTRMNPKISDFGLARIFDGTQTETITTKRIVGTYGYMSPEYALDGSFSVKSDVFSFGIVVLEIVSGRRNTGFYKSKEALNLLGYVWNLWREKRALEIAEVAIRERCNPSDVVKCVAVGLLCVQEDPNDRPTMSNVAFMLSSGSDPTSLPHPKRPAFIDKNSSPSTSSASSSGFKQSNDCSLLEPR